MRRTKLRAMGRTWAAALMLAPLVIGCGGEPAATGSFQGAGIEFLPDGGGFVLLPKKVASLVRPTSIASDGTTLYFTSDYDMVGPRVLKMTVAGENKTTLVMGASTYHGSIGIGGGRVLWDEWGTSTGGVWSMLAGAASGTRIYAVNNDEPQVQNLAVASNLFAPAGDVHAFWGNSATGQLYDVHYAVSSSFPQFVVLSTKPLIAYPPPPAPGPCQSKNCYPWSVAADHANLYFVDDMDGFVYRLPWAGGTPTTLAMGATIGPITTDGLSVFFLKSGSIRKVPVGGGAETDFAPAGGTISSMRARGGDLYWTCSTCGTVMKQPIAGGAAVTLASSQIDARAVALDDTYVYWGTQSALMRLPR